MTMVKISDLGAKDAYGLDDIPALVYFENGIPELYEGDLRNDQGRDSIQSHNRNASPPIMYLIYCQFVIEFCSCRPS